MKLFLQTDRSRKTSERITKLCSGLTSSQVSRWVLLFVLSKVCLFDLGGHVYVMVGSLCETIDADCDLTPPAEPASTEGPAPTTESTWLSAEWKVSWN